MADIKTRDAVKGTIKTIDKAAVASERMKSAYSKIKDKAEQGYYAEESSATEYAADRVSAASERITNEGVHQFKRRSKPQRTISLRQRINYPISSRSEPLKPPRSVCLETAYRPTAVPSAVPQIRQSRAQIKRKRP